MKYSLVAGRMCPPAATGKWDVSRISAKLKFWDDRGLDIVKRALDYPDDNVKSKAVFIVLALGIEKEKAEEVALSVVKKYMYKTTKDYGYEDKETTDGTKKVLMPGFEKEDAWELENKVIKDMWACWNSISALGSLKSKKAIPLLKHIKEKNKSRYRFYVCKEDKYAPVAGALEEILESRGGK